MPDDEIKFGTVDVPYRKIPVPEKMRAALERMTEFEPTGLFERMLDEITSPRADDQAASADQAGQ